MTARYTFLTVHRPTPDAMAAALADVVGVTAADVDVADEEAATAERAWDARVLCGCRGLTGDLALYWDVYVAPDAVSVPPAEPEAASRLAARLGTVVLHPAQGVRPSAYWAVTPDGSRTRARVLEEAGGDEEWPPLTVDAVEERIDQLPGARVEPITEDGPSG
ncbi:hypothetical protein [Streptomyces sp. NPDC001876]|uniref:hypothetical protein n=1 Tax=Streptomyces sp. NPDC001876 TaxID=3154402 RepID=UPI003326AE26